ncbi:hypothetical protein BKA57DRAFT_420392 [Linnemannia elongata]|nr:hypothetical protein BKA57DRAFT_420392 [Linnemannia elongata]
MLFIVAAFVLALLSTASDAQKTVVVSSATRFCLFLPPNPCNGGIANNINSAVAFCKKPLALDPDPLASAKIFLDNFIQTAHFKTNGVGSNRRVQVTGRIKREKYCLKPSDQGAQIDSSHQPSANCAGYPHFVQLVEPNENIYCIRCCRNPAHCPTNIGTEGCRTVISNGDYT